MNAQTHLICQEDIIMTGRKIKDNAKKWLVYLLALTMVLSFAACSGSGDKAEQSDGSIDYMVLVNKLNKLPDGWEDALETEKFINTVGDEVEVEKEAYASYLELKKELEDEGIYVDLDSARRSVSEQQKIMDDFTEEYGADYAKKTVATPGYSEHHTGLALDLYLIIDGQDIVENEDMIQYPEIWAKIHEKLAKHGFILRYLKDKEQVTGYGYEPWHIRYIGDPEKAEEIMSKGITLEEYLGTVNESKVDIDYGTSALYTQEELEEAAIQVKCDFAAWEGCEMHTLRYAGDECNTAENLDWLNSLNEEAGYTAVCEFLSDFHSPKEGGGAWEADSEYTDYQFWLGRTPDGGWEIVTTGY
jgi:LAS superfamily LD-carboxypeptidase LdcB